jgi:hypothetical protein
MLIDEVYARLTEVARLPRLGLSIGADNCSSNSQSYQSPWVARPAVFV